MARYSGRRGTGRWVDKGVPRVNDERIHTFEATVRFMEESVADLSDEEMVEQLSGVPNQGVLTLGHIIFSCQDTATELGPGP